jgi:hypothetical protein
MEPLKFMRWLGWAQAAVYNYGCLDNPHHEITESLRQINAFGRPHQG